jgi:anthranilate/para-aminobenzoate synthase component II
MTGDHKLRNIKSGFHCMQFCHSSCESTCYFCCRGLDKVQRVLLTHGDSIEKVADSFRVVAASGSFPSSIANDKLRLYGVQFHPEVGMFILLSQFLSATVVHIYYIKLSIQLTCILDVFHHVAQ